jgi:hypothetical protein
MRSRQQRQEASGQEIVGHGHFFQAIRSTRSVVAAVIVVVGCEKAQPRKRTRQLVVVHKQVREGLWICSHVGGAFPALFPAVSLMMRTQVFLETAILRLLDWTSHPTGLDVESRI